MLVAGDAPESQGPQLDKKDLYASSIKSERKKSWPLLNSS